MLTPGAHRIEVTSNDLTREYIAYLPESFDEGITYPVVIVFHGGGGQAETTLETTGWKRKADEQQFIVIFPEGTRENPAEEASFMDNPQTWNDGSNRSAFAAVSKEINDVAFVETLITDISARFNINPYDLFTTGFSNGASMSYRIGRELDTHFTAIAPVAGSDWLPRIIPGSPPDLLYITGTDDPLNPFGGGEVYIDQHFIGYSPPDEKMILEWARIHKCSDNATTEIKNDIRTYVYPCPDGVQHVTMHALIGHGHHWPGSSGSRLPASVVGENRTDLNATDTIWAFFEKYLTR